MKVFLIILAVIVLLVIVILSLSAEFTIIFDNGWSTKVKILFIEKEIKISELLSFVLFPDKAGQEAAESSSKKKDEAAGDKATENKEEEPKEEATEPKPLTDEQKQAIAELKAEAEAELSEETENNAETENKPEKPNYIKRILDEDGVVGLMLLITNLIQTLNSAITTLIKGLHIYSLYVKMIIGGGDVADIGEKYGSICGWYYPLKGLILNQMKVDQYDDLITADFIAPRSEYEFQLIGSISVGLLVKVALKAVKVFLVNYFKNK